MSFFTKIKKCLGFSNSKLSEINKIVDKKLREGDRKHWLSISDPKKCLEEKSNEIFEELKKKKNSLGKQYSMKEIKKATTERSRYWANNFNKSRNLIEFELASLCSYLRKLQQKMSNRTFSVLIKIICDRDFLSYENSITLPLFIILLHFFKTKSLIDPKHGNSLLKSYLTLLTQKKSLKGFKDILESLERFFGNENDEISTLIKTLNNKYQNELGTTSIKEIKYGKEKNDLEKDKQDEPETTELTKAIKYNKDGNDIEKKVDALLKNEDTRISTYDLCLAMENCDRPTFKKILEESDKETKNGEYQGETPLVFAIKQNKLDIVNILLEPV